MIKNKFIILLLFTIFIGLISVASFFKNIEKLDKYKNRISSLEYSLDSKREVDYYFSQINDTIYFSELYYNNNSIIDQHFFLGKDSTYRIPLSSLLKNNKVLFFKYPKNACYSCIQSIVGMLSNSFPDYKNNNNIAFISQDIEARFSDNLHGKAVLNTFNSIITFEEIFLEEAPCFFIIDETMQIKYIHFYNKANENRTRIYLKFISSYLKI